MNKEEFEAFVKGHQKQLPLYFKDFVFKETLTPGVQRKVLMKSYASRLYQTDKCRTEQPCKPILRIEK